ncbi:MAG: protein kinase domain-containing protein, partial [Acidobacteriota bacterium]
MGEVYRARDTRLGREVALKVLPEEFAQDPGRLRRFDGESRAASALSDPHIVMVFDVGEDHGVHYFASELVEGPDLRTLLERGRLPLRKALDLAGQIASGLAAAHEKGIVHRDLKPDNILTTKAGAAKVADFGLAKLTECGGGGVAELPTAGTHPTSAGVVVGTVAYMSPEQAQGRAVDFRSDQFALGTILYEMLAGRRPFGGDSAPEMLTAIIREEPPPLPVGSNVPLPIERLIRRCLEKSREDRYGSTRDLARDLEGFGELLAGDGGRSMATAAARPARRLPRLLLLLGLAGLGAGAGYFASSRSTTTAPPSYRPLTFRRGIITGAAFGADGKTVYYSAAWGSEPSRVYATRLDSTESSLLDLPPALLLSVSRNNELAVLLTDQRSPHNSRGTLARVSALGGTPRMLADNVRDADWARDGERLVVSFDDRLEFPLGQVVQTPLGVAQDPRLSPDGRYIAFAGGGGIEITDLSGRRVTRQPTAWQFGKAWAPSSRELWITFSATGGGFDRALYARSLTGTLRLLARAPVALTVWAVGPDSKSALVSTGSGWTVVRGLRPGAAREQSLDLLGRTFAVGISADGRWVLETELREVGGGAYLRSTDGAQTVRLGSDLALGLSPDGGWALVWNDAAGTLMLAPTGPGAPRRVSLAGLSLPGGEMTHVAAVYSRARWARDGQRLFLCLAPANVVYVRDGER